MRILWEPVFSEHFLPASILLATVAGQSKKELRTKSIVATSLAVVKWGRPALGFGTFAMTSFPSFMVRRKVLLKLPSGTFLISTHEEAPIDPAAIRASSAMLN